MASSYFLSPLGIRSLYFAFAFAFSLFPPDNSRIAIIYYIYIYIYIYIFFFFRRVYYIDLNVISEVESKSILLNHNKIVNKSRDTI